MKHFFLHILLYISACTSVLADDISDSLRVGRADTVQVIEKKASFKEKFNVTRNIDLTEFDRGSGSSISDAIRSVPGVTILDYGGAGGIKTVALRGCSASRTAVTIDGMTLNSTGSGTFDFSNFPASIFANAEISRGGLSAYRGSGAIGGVVDLSPGFGKKEISAGLTCGSFKSGKLALSYSDSLFGIAHNFSADFSLENGDYPFTVSDDGNSKQYRRSNADFNNITGAWSFKKNGGRTLLTGTMLFYDSERGVPGAVLANKPENKSARLDEIRLPIIMKGELIVSENAMAGVSMLVDIGRRQYRDSMNIKFGLPQVSTYRENNYILKSEYSVSYRNLGLNFFAEARRADLSGTMLETGDESRVSRMTSALFSGGTYRFPLKAFRLTASGGVRFEFAENPDFFISPAFALNSYFQGINIGTNISWSYNYRHPTFNEMYYLNYGNSDLKPEFASSGNLTVFYDGLPNLRLECSGFLINTVDKIVSVPRSPVTWSVVNTGKTQSFGGEFAARASFWKDRVNLSFAYTLQEVLDLTPGSHSFRKQLPYTPEEIAFGSVSFAPELIKLTADFYRVSHRWSLPDNSYSSLLPSYYTVDMYASKSFDTRVGKLETAFGFKNMTGEEYEIIIGYPMPRHKVFFSVRLRRAIR